MAEKVLERYNINPEKYQELMDFASELSQERDAYFESLQDSTTQAYTPFGAVTITRPGVDAEQYQQDRAAAEAEFDRRFYDKAQELGVPTFIDGNYGPQALSPGWLTQQMRDSGLNFAGAGGIDGESTAGQFVRSVEGERARGEASVDLGDVLSLAPSVMLGAAGVPIGGEIFGNALIGAAQGQDIDQIATTAGLSAVANAAPGMLNDALQAVPDSAINAVFENPVSQAVGAGISTAYSEFNDLLSGILPQGAGDIIMNLAQGAADNPQVSNALLDGLFAGIRNYENGEVNIPVGDIQGPSGMLDIPVLDYPNAPQAPEQPEQPQEQQQTGGGGGSTPSGGTPSGGSQQPSQTPEEEEGSLDQERNWKYMGKGFFRKIGTQERIRIEDAGNYTVGELYSIGEEDITGEEDIFEDTIPVVELPGEENAPQRGDSSFAVPGGSGGGTDFWEEMDAINPDNIYSGGTGGGTGTGDGPGDGPGSGTGSGGGTGGGTGSGGGASGGGSSDFSPFMSGISYTPTIAPLYPIGPQDYMARWLR